MKKLKTLNSYIDGMIKRKQTKTLEYKRTIKMHYKLTHK